VDLACEAQAGFHCPAGTGVASGVACDAGSYCAGGETQAKSCTAAPGNYCARESSQPEGIVCLAGHYCPGANSDKIPCKSSTSGGRRLLNEPARLTELATVLTPPGHYCPAGTEAPGGALCPNGFYCAGGAADKVPCNTQPGYYCPEGGDSADGVPCPANSFCPGGNADAVPCSAPEGSYCPEGSATADGVACPANRCCPGGSSPPEACPAPPLVAFVAETPPPFMLEWFTHKTASRGVESEPAYMSVHRLGDTSEAGFLEGHYNLPVDGRWKVAFDFFVPKYDGGSAAESIFPNEAISAVSADDAIDCNINGVLKTLKSSADLAGHKQSLEFEVEGQVLTYRFDFLSPSVPSFAHPFITAAEITLIRDRNQAPAGGATGKVEAKCIDAVDGRPIKDNGKVSNGYKKNAWKLDSDPTLSVFKGSTLIAQKDMPKGRYKDQLPVGSYSCMVRHVNFYTTFIKNCDITSQGLQLGDVALSPVLNPGDSRIVLEWGAKPKDLDSYLTVPQGARPDCVINYKNKVRVGALCVGPKRWRVRDSGCLQ